MSVGPSSGERSSICAPGRTLSLDTITVSIGWADKTYSKQGVVVEGQPLFDDVETNPTEPYKVGAVTVEISDGNVTLEAGQTDEYTMLNWMSIEPAR